MWVTTGHKPTKTIEEKALEWANRLHANFISRKNLSIEHLMEEHDIDRLLVITTGQPKLYMRGHDQPFFFHPGLSLIRIKSLLRGDNDVMVDVAGLRRGDSFLDCTLGLAGDAIVASYAVGSEGRVVGLESELEIAELTSEGLRTWSDTVEPFNEALRRIEVIHQSHINYLKKQADESFDVVYFDPMFRKGITESSGLAGLRQVANNAPIRPETITEALRVAKRKVMMKERTGSSEFARLGFKKIIKASASISYGVIEK